MAERRAVQALPSLGGLALIGALLPLRTNWAAALALVILCLAVPGVIAGKPVFGLPAKVIHKGKS